MSTKKVLLIVLASNLLLLAGLFGLLHLTRSVYALPVAQPEAEPALAAQGSGLGASVWDQYLYPQVPRQMSYQGVLRDASGNPINGTHNLTFKIWACDPCTIVWSETHSNVSITNGLFSVILGKTDPLDPGDFEGYGPPDWPLLYLSVSVDGGPELQPLPRLISAPYAFRAEYVNRFPAPHWQSAWYTIAQAETKIWTHNLGGNVDNYVVDLQFKSAGDGVNQVTYGGGYDDIGGSYGANWHDLTTSQIKVSRSTKDWAAEQVRVRIWRIE